MKIVSIMFSPLQGLSTSLLLSASPSSGQSCGAEMA